MRTHSDDNPYRGPDGRPTDLSKYMAHEKRAVTREDVDDFLREIAKLEADGKKGTFANLPSGTLVEHARQVARTAGQAEYVKGQGWRITDKGRARLARAS